jgi:hypothetical protein
LGIDTLLSANWGSQTYTYRIREEREGATCQHLIGLLQHVSATCQHLIEPLQHISATCQHLIKPPQHVSATCQHLIGPPYPCGSHISDKWVSLMPRGSQLVVHLILVYATWHSHRRPPHQANATWHHIIVPPYSIYATWHNHRKPPHSAHATWHYTTGPPQ